MFFCFDEFSVFLTKFCFQIGRMYANFILYKYAALKHHKLVVTQVYFSKLFLVVTISSGD